MSHRIRPHRPKWNLLGNILLAGWLCSCQSYSPPAQQTPQAPIAFWHGDDIPGSRKIVIDLTKQQLRYYKGDTQIGLAPIASGSTSHPTPRGNYRVTEKDVDHQSSCYGAYIDIQTGRVVMGDVDNREDPKPPGTRYEGADMRYFMRFNGGIGMHEGFLPGYPASHGCVRMPTDMARIFFHATPVGTPVVVTGDAAYAHRGPRVSVGVPVLAGTGWEEQAPAAQAATESRADRSNRAWFHREERDPPPRGQTLYYY